MTPPSRGAAVAAKLVGEQDLDFDSYADHPLDWPGPGEIDVALHDLPHASSTLEWWYQNAHLVTEDGRRFSVFAAFFRQLRGVDAVTGERTYAHSVTWAVCDVDRSRYVHSSGVDPSAPAEGLARLRAGLGSKDPRLNRALAEILERGHVPTPDRLIEGAVNVATDRLDLRYGTSRFARRDGGGYSLSLRDDRQGVRCDLVFTPRKRAVRHGDQGVVRGPQGETMFYYFIPRCDVSGTIVVDECRRAVRRGQGWCDHEFGVGSPAAADLAAEARLPADARAARGEARRAQREQSAIGWTWLSAQLDDGREISIYPLSKALTGEPAGNHAIVIEADGASAAYSDFEMVAVESWSSTQTFFDHPVRWRARIPAAGVELDVRAVFADQEFITLVSKPSFWEGRVEVTGSVNGAPVQGIGFVERSGFAPFDDLESYFEAVGRAVRRSVEQVVPLAPTYEQARALIASEERDQYMDGVDVSEYARALIHPIREIVDRGGKGWRSYAAITCCDLVGGDSRQFVKWLAMPELMHVGSLIVDDVQDRSDLRRGGPAAHVLYGDAIAINAGTAAYFLTQKLLVSHEGLCDRDRLRIYDLYFEALRAGHAGQALDLAGFDEAMDDAVASGRGEELERRVLAMHRLKTAAPAGCLARMGAIAGGGSDAQIEAVGRFFEALGVSFQIVDDVLNLRGFEGDLKTKGEDVAQGKITFPVAKALSLLGAEDRRRLHHTLAWKPQDPAVVGGVIRLLEDSGALTACAEQARWTIERAWRDLDPLVEDSLAKMMLRAFGWFVLERHY